ncbi:hypothetical protein [Escherichia phage L27]|uniref:Uncharacterized protein n=1 Tax=Escherichia phage L27 TaxID=2562890 RepID=A0A455XGU3_9CAUD|nr:hypothetical protein [Escherichia phage L27]
MLNRYLTRSKKLIFKGYFVKIINKFLTSV